MGCTQEPVTTNILLPVDFSNAPSDMMVTDSQTDKILVKLKGHPKTIKKIIGQDIHYPADLYTDLEFDPAGASESIHTGNYVLPINKGRIPIDPEIIEDVSPSYLKVHLEKKISRIIPVRASYVGTPAPGHIAMEPACKPSLVKVAGPVSIINSLTQIQTIPIELNNTRKTFQKNIPLDIKHTDSIEVSPNIILVTVPIQDKRVSRTINNLPIKVLSADCGGTINPDTISITIKGPFSHVEQKDLEKNIQAFVDIRDLPPGVHARHVNIHIPVELIMVQASPRVFTITIPERQE